jgi:hypothetical protein
MRLRAGAPAASARVDGAAIYSAMARAESDGGLARLYERLAESQDRHASHWEEGLRQGGAAVGPRRASAPARALGQGGALQLHRQVRVWFSTFGVSLAMQLVSMGLIAPRSTLRAPINDLADDVEDKAADSWR